MKDRSNTAMKKKIKIAAIVSFFALLYFAGSLKTLTSGYGATFNPIKIIACCLKCGFPGKEFLLMLLVTGVAFAVVVYKLQKEGGSMDILGRKFKLSKERQVYGDVHFETPQEFRDIAFVQSVDDAMGTILGQMDDKGKELINTNMKNTRDNNHMMVVGASGSGKSFTFTKPYCYQCVKRRESVIITDPDGGLFRDLAGYFQDNGYVVRHFDLNNLKKSDGWDCLNSIQGADIEVMSQMFANTIMSNLVDDVGSIYGSGPMSLLKACILRVALDDGSSFPPEKKNIESVYGMLQNPEGEAYLDSMFTQASMPPGTEPALGPYLAFKQGSPNLRGNLVTNLAVQLQLLQNKLVCQVLSTDDIDMTLPAQQPCAYFCGFPDSHDTYKFIVSLFFSMLFIKLVNFADQECAGRCPVPVNFLLDEFAAIGRIPDFDRKIATVRKRSMNIVMIFQDLTQLQNLYEKSWVTLMENCATFISLGLNDQETANFVNKRIGETTVEVKTVQHDAMESIFRVYNRHSTGEGKRALLTFDELFRIDRDSCVILHSGHNPIFAHKYPHTLHPAAKQQRPIKMSDVPDITDKEGRKQAREKEQAYIEEYLKRHPLSEVDRTYAHIKEPEPEYTIGDEIKQVLARGLEHFVTPVGSMNAKTNPLKPKPNLDNDNDADVVFLEEFSVEGVEETAAEAAQEPAGGHEKNREDRDISEQETAQEALEGQTEGVDKHGMEQPGAASETVPEAPPERSIVGEQVRVPPESRRNAPRESTRPADAVLRPVREQDPAPAEPAMADVPAVGSIKQEKSAPAAAARKPEGEDIPIIAPAPGFHNSGRAAVRKVSGTAKKPTFEEKRTPKNGTNPVSMPPPKKAK